MNGRPTIEPPMPPAAASRRVVVLLALGLVLSGAPAVAVAGEEGRGSAPSAAPKADAELAFTRGVIAFEDGDFAAARDRFQEALRLDPGLEEAHRWLELAEQNLDRAPGAAPVPAPGWAGDFIVGGEVPRFEGRVYLAVGSDSNPNLMPPDLVLATPDGDTIDGEESDSELLADVRLAFQHVSSGGRVPQTWGLVLHGSRSVHDQFGFLDVARTEAVAHLALGSDPLGYLTGPFGYARVPFGSSRVAFLLQVEATRDWLDGIGFAQRFGGGASLTLNEGAWGQTWISGSYEKVDFDDDPVAPLDDILGRSGDHLGGELAQYLFFGKRNRYLRLGVGAGQRDAGTAYDSSSQEANAEVSLPLSGRWTLYLSGARRSDDYDEPVSNLFDPTGKPRQDDETRVGGSLVFRALERLFLSGRVTWTDHEIDLPAGFATPDLSYDRTIATLGASWVF